MEGVEPGGSTGGATPPRPLDGLDLIGLPQTEVAQQIVWGSRPPSMEELLELLVAAAGDDEAWATLVRDLRHLRNGMLSASIWSGTYRWTEGPAVVGDEALARKDDAGWSPAERSIMRTISDGLVAQFEEDCRQHLDSVDGQRMLRTHRFLAPGGLVAHGGTEQSRLVQVETLRREVEKWGLESSATTLCNAMSGAVRANVPVIMQPISRSFDAPDGGTTPSDAVDVATRSQGIVRKLTGLAGGASFRAMAALEIPVDRVPRLRWSDQYVGMVDAPAPHLEVMVDGHPASLADLPAGPVLGGAVTVGDMHREAMERGRDDARHLGCPASIPLSPYPGAPKLSAISMLFANAAERLAAAHGMPLPGVDDVADVKGLGGTAATDTTRPTAHEAYLRAAARDARARRELRGGSARSGLTAPSGGARRRAVGGAGASASSGSMQNGAVARPDGRSVAGADGGALGADGAGRATAGGETGSGSTVPSADEVARRPALRAGLRRRFGGLRRPGGPSSLG